MKKIKNIGLIIMVKIKIISKGKLDRMRYYVNEKNVEGAIKILKKILILLI